MNNEQERQLENATQELLRGQKAEELLKNPAYQEGMLAIRADLFNKLTQTTPGYFGRRKRDELHRQIRTFDRMQAYFESVVQTGKMGRNTISLLTKSKKMRGL